MTYGLNGIFNNGVLGMNAFSEAMGTISDNLANIQTVGYKKVETQFATLLGQQTGPARNTMGVVTNTRQLVDVKGPITQTGRVNDLAINGQGMFIYASGEIDPNSGVFTPGEYFYSRAGNLRDFVPPVRTAGTSAAGTDQINASTGAYLANQQGLYLLGVPSTTPGVAVTLPTSLTDLQPIQVNNQAPFPGIATTSAALTAVIPSPSGLAGAAATSSAFASTATDLTGSGTLFPPPLNAGDTFDITANGVTYPITIAAGETLQSLVTNINTTIAGLGGSADVFASISGTAAHPSMSIGSSFDLTITDTLGASAVGLFNFAASPATVTATSVSSVSTPIHYVGDNFVNGVATGGQSIGVTLIFSNPVTVPGVSTTWQVTSTGAGATSAPTTVTFDNNGRVTQVGATAGNTTLTITDAITQGAQTITNSFNLDMTNVAMLGNEISQGQANQISYTQDGLIAGLFEGLQIESDGDVVGQYSGGGTQVLYRIPVASFASPNALQSVSGTMYQPTVQSGSPDDTTGLSFTFRFPGDDFASFEIGAVEQSNVDVADSFSQMIITQRAYSSAATVVRTADEMSVVARDLKR